MTSIISTAAQAAYNVATYILAYASTQVGRNVFVAEVMDAEKSVSKSLTNSPDNRNMPMSPSNEPLTDTEQSKDLNQDLNDITYIPWPAPSSHVRVTPDMLPWESFVVSCGEVRYDLPLRSCDRKLPLPDEVRAAASLLPLKVKRHIVPFPALGIVVKFGPRPGQTSETGGVLARVTSLSEAQSLYAVRRFLGNRVPVPEVYAFVHDDNQSFLYMELVQGITIRECWADLSDETKKDVCAQLKPMMQALRELEQEPSDSFIGTMARQPPQDVMFEARRNPGPFASITAFHDYFSNPRNLLSSPHPLRNILHDNQKIYFTHADINKANIIVSPPSDGPVRIRAIVDWQQSGWYPANWEYCKARWQTSDRDLESWRLSEFLERWPTRWFWEWDYFTMSLL